VIRVVIADDQELMREGTKYMIEKGGDIEVVGCVNNGKEAFELCGTVNPDLVLMDIVMPEHDGIEGTRMIKAKYNSIKILILSTYGSSQNVSKAIGYGADGYVLKDIKPDELIYTIKCTVSGLNVMNNSVFNDLKSQFNPTDQQSDMNDNETESKHDKYGNNKDVKLNETEKEIIRLVVYGKSNKEIAAALFYSPSKVRNTISNVLAKLELKDRTQLAVYAVKNNIV